MINRAMTIFLCFLTLLLRIGIQNAAADPPVNYWPFQNGNQWKMSLVLSSGQKIDLTITAGDVHREHGYLLATLSYLVNGKVSEVEVYKSDSSGIRRIQGGPGGNSKFNPPMLLIKYPLKNGSSWNWDGKANIGTLIATYHAHFQVTGPFVMKTPAGAFHVMRIHSDLNCSIGKTNQTIPNDYWFANGIGLIKQSILSSGLSLVGKLTEYKLKK